MPTRSHLVSALAALLLAGCSTRGIELHEERLTSPPGSLGVVRVERTVPDVAPGVASTVVDAVFARYAGVDDEGVLGLLGWSSHTLEGCRWDSTVAPLVDFDATVELLDVGTLQVESAAGRLVLEGRLFPSMQSVLAGTFYAEEVEQPMDLDESDRELRLAASGADELGRFDALAAVPDPLMDVTVDGAQFAHGLEVPRDRNLYIRWEAGDPHDRVEVDIRAGRARLRCGAADDGELVLRVEALAQLPEDGAAQLSLSRVRIEPLAVRGIDEAHARLSSRRTASVSVR